MALVVKIIIVICLTIFVICLTIFRPQQKAILVIQPCLEECGKLFSRALVVVDRGLLEGGNSPALIELFC